MSSPAGRLIIICGLPGTGRTTFSGRLDADNRERRVQPPTGAALALCDPPAP